MISEYKVCKCDYCGDKKVKTRSTPYMADILSGARMCKRCWEDAKEIGLKQEEMYIGEFEIDKQFPSEVKESTINTFVRGDQRD